MEKEDIILKAIKEGKGLPPIADEGINNLSYLILQGEKQNPGIRCENFYMTPGKLYDIQARSPFDDKFIALLFADAAAELTQEDIEHTDGEA